MSCGLQNWWSVVGTLLTVAGFGAIFLAFVQGIVWIARHECEVRKG